MGRTPQPHGLCASHHNHRLPPSERAGPPAFQPVTGSLADAAGYSQRVTTSFNVSGWMGLDT